MRISALVIILVFQQLVSAHFSIVFSQSQYQYLDTVKVNDLINQGDFSGIKQHADEVLEKDISNKELHKTFEILGDSYEMILDHEQSKMYLSKAVELAKKEKLGPFRIASSLIKLGENAESRGAYD
ncbi:MAG: hypothetical protein AAGK97_13595, partial [Bacteroidota bacterium]